MMEILPWIFMVGLLGIGDVTVAVDGIINAIINLINTIVSIANIVRKQLAEIIDRVLTVMLWFGDKAYHFLKFVAEQFPYDNYQRIFMLSILIVIVFSSVLAFFAVGSLAPVIALRQDYVYTGGFRTTNASEISANIGSNALGEGGTGVDWGQVITSGNVTAPTGQDNGTGTGGGGTGECNDCNSNNGDINGNGIPDQSDVNMDGDQYPNDQDPDIDGDGIPNPNDATPCGASALCPPSTTGDGRMMSYCGDGICEGDTLTSAVAVANDYCVNQGYSDQYAIVRIPYWCINPASRSLQQTVYNGEAVAFVCRVNILDILANDVCVLATGGSELYYRESATTCPEDCWQQNVTLNQSAEAAIVLSHCHNLQKDDSYGDTGICFITPNGTTYCHPETGIDCTDGCDTNVEGYCGNACPPCHCIDGVYEPALNETGVDCGGQCPKCACNVTGMSLSCSSLYCCPTGSGDCTKRCLQFPLGYSGDWGVSSCYYPHNCHFDENGSYYCGGIIDDSSCQNLCKLHLDPILAQLDVSALDICTVPMYNLTTEANSSVGDIEWFGDVL
jgi:hypothetical protein